MRQTIKHIDRIRQILKEFVIGVEGEHIDRIRGGTSDSVSPDEFDPDELAHGINHEMEHTDDPELAEEIAMDHLTEDPYYYSMGPVSIEEGTEDWDLSTASELNSYDSSDAKSALKANDKNQAEQVATIFTDPSIDVDIDRFVARGAYGFVFIGSPSTGPNAGMKMALKVTGAADAKAYTKIMEMTAKVPERVAKHLPRIYGVTTVPWPKGTENIASNASMTFDDDTVSIVAMEILKPLPSDVDDMLFSTVTQSKIAAKEVMTNEHLLVGLIRRAVEDYNRQMSDSKPDPPGAKHLYSVKYSLSKIAALRVEGDILSGGGDTAKWEAALGDDVANLSVELKKACARGAKAVGTLFQGDGNFRLAGLTFGRQMGVTIKKAGRIFPLFSDTREFPRASSVPGAASLLHAVKVLKNMGISWADVHGGNVMVRPATGDIVIADVGMFEYY